MLTRSLRACLSVFALCRWCLPVRHVCIAVAVAASVFSTSLAAEVINNLYRVTVAVESQSASELKRASRDALAELFVRVSGKEAVLAERRIVSAISSAQSYTKQYSYETVTEDELTERLQAVIEFEPQLVLAALRDAQQPLWSDNRPTILLWLAVEDRSGRRFAGALTDPAIVQAIAASSVRRGLAVKLPVLDLEDMIALSPDDIWQQNSAKLEAASERYGADTLLVGRVTHLNNGQWLGRWTFRYGGESTRFDGEADDIDNYIALSLNQVAETLASKYAIAPVKIAEGGILMRLSDVRNFVDYARAVSYLEGVAAVHHANVVSLEGEELILRLIADGELPQLQQAFALDKRLLPQQGAGYAGPYPVSLDYRWPSTVDSASLPVPALAPQPVSAAGSPESSPEISPEPDDFEP